jgi:hypothetical protein
VEIASLVAEVGETVFQMGEEGESDVS